MGVLIVNSKPRMGLKTVGSGNVGQVRGKGEKASVRELGGGGRSCYVFGKVLRHELFA